MNFELVSFKICPFVQRAVLTLLRKDIPYKITYIDLASPPEWFKQLSPFGKVPILRVDEQQIIFESSIINEFLEDAYPGQLLPQNPVQRALNRGWIEFGSNLTLNFSGLIHSGDAKEFEAKLQSVKKQFEWLETELGHGPYFNDNDFSLVDIAYAPLFFRVDLLNLEDMLFPSKSYPKVTNWAEKLLSMPELPKSVVNDFEVLFKSHLKNKAPYVATRLNL